MPERLLPNGVRLHWREAGDPAQPPIVWIHGGSVEDSSFMVAGPRAASSSGCGRCSPTRAATACPRSSSASRTTGYAQKAEDVLLWLDALGDRARGVGRGLDGRRAVAVGGDPRARARAGGDLDQRAALRAARPRTRRGGGRTAPLVEAGPRRRVLRRQRAAADGRGRAGAVQGAARALRGDDRAAARATRPPRCWRCSTRPTRATSGSPTARASAARCWSIAGIGGSLSDGGDVRAGWRRPSPARACTSSRAAGTFPIARTGPRSRR